MSPDETADRPDSPASVDALYAGVAEVLNTTCDNGRKIGDCQWGVYAFYDYDGEPIYVGQTKERLRNRIRRHLTNQRTDAVAMSVLDPFEVAEIEMWPFWRKPSKERLNQAEYTVYRQALARSKFSAVLNEVEPPATATIALPPSKRLAILSAEARREQEHPDVRLARRARTLANLARVISERRVRPGIRRTLWVQAQRLEKLAEERLDDFASG